MEPEVLHVSEQLQKKNLIENWSHKSVAVCFHHGFIWYLPWKNQQSRAKPSVMNEVIHSSIVFSFASRALSHTSGYGGSPPSMLPETSQARGSWVSLLCESNYNCLTLLVLPAGLCWAGLDQVFEVVLVHGHVSFSGENSVFGRAEVCS